MGRWWDRLLHWVEEQARAEQEWLRAAGRARPSKEETETHLRNRERALAAIHEKQDSQKLLEGTQARIRFLEEQEQAALSAGDAEESARRREELDLRRAELPALLRRHEKALAHAEALKAEMKRKEEQMRARIEEARSKSLLAAIERGMERGSRAPLWQKFLLLLLLIPPLLTLTLLLPLWLAELLGARP